MVLFLDRLYPAIGGMETHGVDLRSHLLRAAGRGQVLGLAAGDPLSSDLPGPRHPGRTPRGGADGPDRPALEGAAAASLRPGSYRFLGALPPAETLPVIAARFSWRAVFGAYRALFGL